MMLTLLVSLLLGQSPAFDIQPGFVVAVAEPEAKSELPPQPHDRPAFWPAGVPWTAGMREYRKAAHSQRIVILNDRDDNRWQHAEQDDFFSNAPTVINPNRLFPWRFPGGLDRVGHSNRTFVYHPAGTSVVKETRMVEIPNAGRNLPRHFWWHPDGTILADVLLNGKSEVFEVRIREKANGGWHNFRFAPRHAAYRSETLTANVQHDVLNRHGVTQTTYKVRRVDDLRGIPFQRVPLEITYTDDGKLTPVGYVGPGLHCNTCHVHSGSTTYGIAVRGGGDGDFSYSPYEDR